MFAAFIRRGRDGGSLGDADLALASTIFSLSTDVPRPTDQRAEQRLLAILPAAKLVGDGWQDLCRIRNLSAGGLMAEVTTSRDTVGPVVVEINSNQSITGTIVWTRETTVGIKFAENVDLREILAQRRPRIGFRPRPARLDVRCGATVRIGALYHPVEVHDISLGGIKVWLDARDHVGKDVIVTVESLHPIKGIIRWHKEGYAGIVFHKPLEFGELAEWLGKRLEVASLRAASVPVERR
jgi:hypothetical protein